MCCTSPHFFKTNLLKTHFFTSSFCTPDTLTRNVQLGLVASLIFSLRAVAAKLTDLVVDESPLFQESVDPHDGANVAGEVSTTSSAGKSETIGSYKRMIASLG
jgi:hypothetical protein